MRKRVIVFALLVALSVGYFAAMNPFLPLFSNPNISYRLVKTKYLNVVYEPGCEWAVYQFLKKCDSIYTKITDFYNTQPFSRLTVVFENDTDVVNSLADPIDNVIYIFLNSSERAFFSQDMEEWVDFVFSHELTHILITQMGGPSKVRVFGNALSSAYNATFIPAYLQEGLAQYSETYFNSGHGRLNDPLFEMYLAGLVASKEFKGLGGGASYNANGWYPVGAPYMLGGSFVRYVADKYGNSALKKAIFLLSKDHLQGVAFAFEKATGVDFKKLVDEWIKSVKNSVKSRMSGFPIEGIQLTRSGRWTAFVSTSSTNEVYFYRENPNDAPSIMAYSIKTSSFKHVCNVGGFLYQGGYIRSMSVSPNDEKLAFVRLVSENNGFDNRARCFVMNLKDGSLKELPMKDALQISWYSNDQLVYITESGGLYSIREYNVKDDIMKTLMPLSKMVITSIFAGKNEILFSANVDGTSDIYRLQNGKIYKIISGKYVKIDPFLTNDGKFILFSAAQPNMNGIYNVYALDLQTKSFYKITNVKFGAFNPMIVKGQLFYAGYTPNGYNLFALDRWFSTAQRVDNFKYVEEPYKNDINLTKIFLSVGRKSERYTSKVQTIASGIVPLVSFQASSTTSVATYTVFAFDYLRTKLGWNNLYAFGALSTNKNYDFLNVGMVNYGKYTLAIDFLMSYRIKQMLAWLAHPVTSLVFGRDLLFYPSLNYTLKEMNGMFEDKLEFNGSLLYSPTFVPNNTLDVHELGLLWNVSFSPLKPATPSYTLNVNTSFPWLSSVFKIGCTFENGEEKLSQNFSFPKFNINWYNVTGTWGWRYIAFLQYATYAIHSKGLSFGLLTNLNFEFSSYGNLNVSIDLSYNLSKKKFEYAFGLNF